MKKLLAILGSIGLTSTTASAVIACGNGGNANIGGNKNIVVNPDITNGSYDAASKTFTAQYGSDQYQAHKISFSLTKVVLKVENIQVVNAQGTNIDQESGLWKFWISENGANTVFEIEDSSLNGATIQINLDNHLSTSFKIAIHQDQNLVVNNVINGTYEKATTTLTANYQSSQYSENKMRFSLANVSLSESNFNVIKSDGTKAEAKDGLWSYVVSDNTTTVHIDDYHLNQATIQINLDGYNSITFKIVINQSKEIAIDNTVNGNYNSASKTFTATYSSAQYDNHKMSFTINDLTLDASNVVVKAVGEQVTTGWSLSTTTNTTTITLDDYHLNGATIEVKDVEGYWPVTFNIIINQDQDIMVGSITNGGYNAGTKTFTAASGSSIYEGREMSFALNGVTLSTDNIVVKNSADQSVAQNSGWSFAISGENTTITIDDYNLNGATIEVKDVEGYWPVTFNIIINQDQNVFVNPEVTKGKYDDSTKTFTADFSSGKYEANHLLFSLRNIILEEQNIVVKDGSGQVIEPASDRWSSWIAADGLSTVFEIKDGSMDGATITIQGLDGYWPVTFSIIITQDKHFVIADVTNGEYVESTKTFTAKYGNSIYHEEGHQMSFKIKGLALQGKDFVLVKDNSGQEITTGWESVVSGSDTIITISDYNLNNAKVIVQNVDGYWPETFNVAIPQDQVFSPNVTNGSYDTSTNTLTAKYGNSTYQEGHEMSFTLSDISLSADNIVVKDSKGATITSGWNFTTSDENATITVDDYNLNGATIQIQDVDGYWPIVFNVVIPQDQNVVVNSDVSHGKYDDSTKTLIADYESNQYDSDSNHNMYFSLYNLVLNKNNIIVKDVGGDIVDVTTDRWSFWTSFDNNRKVENTVFQIKDSKLNGATIEIKDVDGYWPIKLKIVINQSQE